MPEVALTLDALLTPARDRLATAGVDDAADEAMRLWSGLWRVSPPEAYLARRAVVTHDAAARFEEAVARRAAGEPLAYVVGWAGFRHLEVATDRRALIPRPETEGVVDLLLQRQATGMVADIGTGSGCLALALADEGDFGLVHAVDSSADALALAAANAEALHVTIRWHHGDLVAPLAGLELDALVSNPPYLTDAEYAALDPSVKAWEPAGALVSGVDGLAHVRRLLDEARGVVRPGGWMVMEIDSQRSGASAASARHFGWAAVEVHQDLFGRDRYLTARRSEA
ncbi:MAG: peptide chain release factor N(5)-glutamine methyltransferase [Gemmatimonadales bacterium]